MKGMIKEYIYIEIGLIRIVMIRLDDWSYKGVWYVICLSLVSCTFCTPVMSSRKTTDH